MGNGLVLSIFPGIDLLGRAFEEEGYTVVRGPDPLWGGDIRRFHVPAGVFEGVIGGPPCQYWTRLMFLNKEAGKGRDWVVNEYARVVEEAQPDWFLMEEVPFAPMPLVPGYHDYDVLLKDNEVGGGQPRERRFTFGTKDYRMLNVVGWEQVNETTTTMLGNGHNPHLSEGWGEEGRRRRQERNERKQSVLADGRAVPVKQLAGGKEKRSVGGSLPHSRNGDEHQSAIGRADLGDMCEAQGLPRDFTDHMPFTKQGKQLVIGNGVPQAMARAVARAVRAATVV